MPSDHSDSSHCDSGGGSYSGGGDSYSGCGCDDLGYGYDYRHRGGEVNIYSPVKPSEEDMYTTEPRKTPKIIASGPAKGYYSFRCICGTKHDYRLFESDWKDKEGTDHKAGWYDELNNRHDGVATDNVTGAVCICGSCKQRCFVDIHDQNIKQYECPNCKATMNVEIVKEDEVKVFSSEAKEYFIARKREYAQTIFVFSFILIFSLYMMRLMDVRIPIFEKQIEQESTKETGLRLKYIGNNCYISTGLLSPDKTLVWDGKDYHDTELDFYVWYNEKVNKYQYWYEPISGDYGAYGWMEYDLLERRWYIEVKKGEWIIVPEEYDTSTLYHIVW